MEIKQIQVIVEPGGMKTVFGLGDDNNVYLWGYSEGKWEATFAATAKTATIIPRYERDPARQNPAR